jgi:hypothetical protein
MRKVKHYLGRSRKVMKKNPKFHLLGVMYQAYTYIILLTDRCNFEVVCDAYYCSDKFWIPNLKRRNANVGSKDLKYKKTGD